MIRFLVDTNVPSATAPASRPTAALTAWMEARSGALALSVVTVAEIASGVATLEREGATRRAASYRDWLDSILRLYRQRILPIDLDVGRLTGELIDRARGIGHDPGFPDLARAATALRYDLTLVTRNLRHFLPFGIDVVDPLSAG